MRENITKNKERVLLLHQGRLEIRHWVALATGFVVIALLGLSLDHLAAGLEKMSLIGGGDPKPYWHHLALAIGFDFGLLCSELGIIVATVLGLRGVKVTATFVLISTVCVSAFMNGLSLTEGLEPWTFYWVLGSVIGGFIPLLVLLLSKFATGLVVGEIDESIRIRFQRFQTKGSNVKEARSKGRARRSRTKNNGKALKTVKSKGYQRASQKPKEEIKPMIDSKEKTKAAGTVKPEPAQAAAA